MSKILIDEATVKLVLNKAFQLGQRYWSWADSEYSSHWKKADTAKAEFDQLMQDTINAALAEQPAQQTACTWVGLTEEEKTELRREHYPLPLLLMEATEAKLRSKNEDRN